MNKFLFCLLGVLLVANIIRLPIQRITQYYYKPVVGRPSVIPINTMARFIRITLCEENWLNLAEVEVIGTSLENGRETNKNLARGKYCRQSSTACNGLAIPEKALDGNTSGNYKDGSISHTNRQKNPWWEVDLGKVYSISEARIWNRSDGVEGRLKNLYITVTKENILPTNDSNHSAMLGFIRLPAFFVFCFTLAWLFHFLWWRICRPVYHNAALLVSFAIGLIVSLFINIAFPFNMSPIKDLWELLLFLSLYIPLALMYISLYSLIEEESPTLSAIEFLRLAGSNGQDYAETVNEMNQTNDRLLQRRIDLLARDGIFFEENEELGLTDKGRIWARIFTTGATIIGLRKGV